MLVPAILAKSQKEFKKKLDAVLPFSDFVQVDIMDGKFVPNKTWGNPKVLADLSAVIDFEVHLMVKNPEKVIGAWAEAGAKRIIFHIEAAKNPEELISLIKKYKKQGGLAINPETPASAIKKYLPKINHVLVMGVNPGFSGQKFQTKALAKIKKIRQLAPKIKIGVDGGVDFKNFSKIKKAGASYLCAASAIFNDESAKEAFKKFR